MLYHSHDSPCRMVKRWWPQRRWTCRARTTQAQRQHRRQYDLLLHVCPIFFFFFFPLSAFIPLICPSSLSTFSQKILPNNGRHATMGTSAPRSAPHGNDIHVVHSTRLSASRARYGTVPVGVPARHPEQRNGATCVRDVWSSVLDCAVAGDRRAGGPVD